MERLCAPAYVSLHWRTRSPRDPVRPAPRLDTTRCVRCHRRASAEQPRIAARPARCGGVESGATWTLAVQARLFLAIQHVVVAHRDRRAVRIAVAVATVDGPLGVERLLVH